MDYQHREGGKTGSGGLLNSSESNAERRERLRKLALETIDLSKDPYFMKNHLGSYECRLCLTLHVNEGSYLVHTQGKKHQANLGRRRAREAAQSGGPDLLAAKTTPLIKPNVSVTPKVPKIGRPGYKLTKIRDPVTKYTGVLLQIHYPFELMTPSSTTGPLTRFMSAFEQRVEPPNKLHQYLIVAALPYDTMSFKVPNREVETSWSHWDKDTRVFTRQVIFKSMSTD